MSGGQPPRRGLLRRVLSQPVTSVADAVMPALVDAVDLDEALGRIDLDELLEHVDIDALVSRIDAQALVARLDLNALLDTVDVDRLLDRVDVDRLVKRLDVESVVKRVDVNDLVQRLDVNEVVQRLDVNAVVQRLDVNAVLENIDAASLTGTLGSVLTRGTESLVTSFLDLFRRQAVGLDVVLLRLVDRLLHRQPGELPTGPGLLAPAPEGAAPGAQVSGRYAGPVSRLLGFTLDVGIILASFAVGTSALNYLIRLLSGYQLERNGTSGVWWTVALVVWAFTYLWIGPAVAGRTVGMALAGLRVVATDGSPLSQRQSFVRVMVLPVSIVLLGIGFVTAVLGGRRQALHDKAAGTCVVYDWGDRPAEMPAPLTKWLSRRGAIDVVSRPHATSVTPPR